MAHKHADTSDGDETIQCNFLSKIVKCQTRLFQILRFQQSHTHSFTRVRVSVCLCCSLHHKCRSCNECVHSIRTGTPTYVIRMNEIVNCWTLKHHITDDNWDCTVHRHHFYSLDVHAHAHNRHCDGPSFVNVLCNSKTRAFKTHVTQSHCPSSNWAMNMSILGRVRECRFWFLCVFRPNATLNAHKLRSHIFGWATRCATSNEQCVPFDVTQGMQMNEMNFCQNANFWPGIWWSAKTFATKIIIMFSKWVKGLLSRYETEPKDNSHRHPQETII